MQNMSLIIEIATALSDINKRRGRDFPQTVVIRVSACGYVGLANIPDEIHRSVHRGC